MHISLGVTFLFLSTMVQSFPTSSPDLISDAAPQVLDLAIRSPSTDLEIFHTPTAQLSPRQGPNWKDYGLLACNKALNALKYVVILKGTQRLENVCRLYATNKNYENDVQIRVQKGNGPKERFTVNAATCSAQINMVNVFRRDQFRLEVLQQ